MTSASELQASKTTLAKRVADRLFGRQAAHQPGMPTQLALPMQPVQESRPAPAQDYSMPFVVGAVVGATVAAAIDSQQPRGEQAHITLSLGDDCDERPRHEHHSHGQDFGL